jgi:hypothetical protein
VLSILFQIIERLSQENEIFKTENQNLRDEISLLKREQGKPKICANKKPWEDISSKQQRKKSQKRKSTKLK